jgi:hypothetical protein
MKEKVRETEPAMPPLMPPLIRQPDHRGNNLKQHIK